MIAPHRRPGVACGCIKKPRLAPSDPVSTWLRLLWIAVPQHRFNFRNVIWIKDRQTAIAQSGGVLTGLEQRVNFLGRVTITASRFHSIRDLNPFLSHPN